MLKYVPGVRMIAGYQPRWLPKDLMAGLVLTAILVPQGMAYAELAGLPAITGLYTRSSASSGTPHWDHLGSWCSDRIRHSAR